MKISSLILLVIGGMVSPAVVAGDSKYVRESDIRSSSDDDEAEFRELYDAFVNGPYTVDAISKLEVRNPGFHRRRPVHSPYSGVDETPSVPGKKASLDSFGLGGFGGPGAGSRDRNVDALLGSLGLGGGGQEDPTDENDPDEGDFDNWEDLVESTFGRKHEDAAGEISNVVDGRLLDSITFEEAEIVFSVFKERDQRFDENDSGSAFAVHHGDHIIIILTDFDEESSTVVTVHDDDIVFVQEEELYPDPEGDGYDPETWKKYRAWADGITGIDRDGARLGGSRNPDAVVAPQGRAVNSFNDRIKKQNRVINWGPNGPRLGTPDFDPKADPSKRPGWIGRPGNPSD